MHKVVYLTVVASSVFCFALIAQVVGNAVTLELGADGPAAEPGRRLMLGTERLLFPTGGWLAQLAPDIGKTTSKPAGTAIIGELGAGFGALAFRYASSTTAEVQVFDGTEGKGRLLAHYTLAPTDTADTPGQWRDRRLEFAGIAQSFVIRTEGGAVRLDQLRFDKVPDTAHRPPPARQPSAAELLAAGACVLLLAAPRRSDEQRIGKTA